MDNKRFGFTPCFVKSFKGFDTAGQPVFEMSCICPECLGRTTPIHPWVEEKKDERSEPDGKR